MCIPPDENCLYDTTTTKSRHWQQTLLLQIALIISHTHHNAFQHHVSIAEEQANIAERQVSITKQVGITKQTEAREPSAW